MARRKSYRDIQNQALRLLYGQNPVSGERRRIVEAARNKYLENIRNANAFKRDQSRLQDAIYDATIEENEALGRWVRTYRGTTPAGGDDPDMYEFVVDEDAFPKLAERPYKRHYTRAVYQQGRADDIMSARAQSRFAEARKSTVNAAMANVGG